jgi:hypothetical protein
MTHEEELKKGGGRLVHMMEREFGSFVDMVEFRHSKCQRVWGRCFKAGENMEQQLSHKLTQQWSVCFG